MKFFPVMAGPYGRDDTYACVPWELVEPHEQQAQLNHSQSLQRLAERGGLAWSEILAVVEDREFRRMNDREAAQAVMARLIPKRDAAALVRKYLAYDSQRAASWHEVQDCAEAIEKLGR